MSKKVRLPLIPDHEGTAGLVAENETKNGNVVLVENRFQGLFPLVHKESTKGILQQAEIIASIDRVFMEDNVSKKLQTY